jgi:hypothetical protein
LALLAAFVVVNYLFALVVASASLTVLYSPYELVADLHYERVAGGLGVFVDVLDELLFWKRGWGGVVAACCSFVALTQGAFLVPTFAPLTRGGGQRSLRWTATAAAGMVAAFTVAWLWALVTTLDLYLPHDPPDGLRYILIVPLCGAFAASWLYWGALFYRAAVRSDAPDVCLIRRVFGATGILVAATIPLDVMTRRKTQCYCTSGSAFALCWGFLGAFWLLGPWLLRHRIARVRHELSGAYCMRCGHARGPSSSSVCPECGHAHPRLASTTPRAAVPSASLSP